MRWLKIVDTELRRSDVFQKNFNEFMNTKFYIIENGVQVGPFSVEELRQRNLRPDTLVWSQGMTGWTQAMSVDALSTLFFSDVPPQPQYDPRGNAYPANYTNWLPWAIVATVLGLTNCIGIVFGIIGIVNANKANESYAFGDPLRGSAYNSTAKIMTIIGLVLSGLTVVSTIGLFNFFPWTLGIL